MRKGFSRVSLLGLIVLLSAPSLISSRIQVTLGSSGGAYLQVSAVTSPIGWDGLQTATLTQIENGGTVSATRFDIDVGASSAYVMEVVHGWGEIFTKNGSVVVSPFFLADRVFNAPTCGPYHSRDGIDDTRILFEISSGRWFLTAMHDTYDANCNFIRHHVDIAVSYTSDPTGSWKTWHAIIGSATDQAASASATQTLTLFANASYSASVTSSASGQPGWMQVSFTPSTATPPLRGLS